MGLARWDFQEMDVGWGIMNTHKNLTQAILQFDWMMNPTGASAKGIHLYDGKLPPVLQSERKNYLNIAKDLLEQTNELLAQTLSLDEEIDLLVGKEFLTKTIADEELLRPWSKSPMHYVSIVAQGLNTLLSENISETQAISLYQRMLESKKFLQEAQKTLQLRSIPELWIKPSLASMKGLLKLIDDSVTPLLIKQNLANQFNTPLNELINELNVFSNWLQDNQEIAKGEFAVGERYFDTLLNEFYLVSMTTDELLSFGQNKVALYEEKLISLAKSLNPNLTWQDQLQQLHTNHPEPDDIIKAYQDEKETARKFIVEKDLVTIPEGQNCVMGETPWYARPSTPLGSMSTARAYTPGLVSTFNLTPIDKQATPTAQLQHLEENNYSFIKSITFHEVIPGHHLQACKHKLQKNEFRKNFYNTVLIEGWGLYTEDLMVEEGFLEGVLHLMQLKNALWRAARVVIDVSLHTNKMTFEEAVNLLQEKVGQQRHMATGEVLRYTQGPTYPSSYMLGREQILKLREDCQSLWGDGFTKKRFHDTLLSYGSLPVSLIRRLIFES